jgi:D-glycero-alpha-D-manno-heptose 1-phosphate guanylyltransferase
MDQLVAAGFEAVTLCTGYGHSMIAEYFGHQYRTLDLHYSCETEPLGTGGALRLAADKTPPGELMLVLNGDSYSDLSLPEFMACHQSSNKSVSMAAVHVNDVSRYGSVRVSEEDELLAFEEKNGQQRPGFINAGIYLLPNKVVMGLPARQALSIEEDVFAQLPLSGVKVYRHCGYFIDIGTPASYRRAQIDLAGSYMDPLASEAI